MEHDKRPLARRESSDELTKSHVAANIAGGLSHAEKDIKQTPTGGLAIEAEADRHPRDPRLE
jgi:hypothetical protein